MRCDISDDQLALIAVVVLVATLLVVRACIPPARHHPAERPLTPPESLYAAPPEPTGTTGEEEP